MQEFCSYRLYPPINPLGRIDGGEEPRLIPQGLGTTQDQNPAGVESLGKAAKNPLLLSRVKVDEDITTEDQLGRRIMGFTEEIVANKTDHRPELLPDPVAPPFGSKTTGLLFGGNVAQMGGVKEAAASLCENFVTDIGGENFHPCREFRRLRGEEGQRVGLLTPGAAGTPPAPRQRRSSTLGTLVKNLP